MEKERISYIVAWLTQSLEYITPELMQEDYDFVGDNPLVSVKIKVYENRNDMEPIDFDDCFIRIRK